MKIFYLKRPVSQNRLKNFNGGEVPKAGLYCHDDFIAFFRLSEQAKHHRVARSVTTNHVKGEAAVLMVWHKDKWLSPTLDAFLEMVRQNFKDTSY